MPRRHVTVLLAALIASVVGACASAQAQPFYGYGTIEGICPGGSWTSIGADGLGTDCNDLTLYRPAVAALPNTGAAGGVQRPAVYRMPIDADGVQAKTAGTGSWANPWQQYDTSVKWAATQGSKVVLVAIQGKGCTDTANCASLSACLPLHTCSTWEPYSYWVPSTGTQLTRYQTWIQQIVQHYSGPGTLAQAVQAIEVWNEPNTEDPHEAGLDIDHQTWTDQFVRGAPEVLLSPNKTTNSGTADVHTFTPSLYAQVTCAALAGRKAATDAGATRKDIYVGALAWDITSGTSTTTGTSYYSLSSPAGSPGGPMGRWLSDSVALHDAAHGCPAGSGWHAAQRYDAQTMHAYSGPQAASPLTGSQTGVNTCVTPTVTTDTRANVNGCKIALAFEQQHQAVKNNQSTTGGTTDRIIWDEFGVRAGGSESSGLVYDAATQATAIKYLQAKCKSRALTDQDSVTAGLQAQIAGCYVWPLRSKTGSASSTIEGSGLWTNALAPNAASTPWRDALEDQRLNPTQYP